MDCTANVIAKDRWYGVSIHVLPLSALDIMHWIIRWQNERQPHYNTLAAGDVDTMRSFLDFYLRMLPYVNERTKAQWRNTDAPELTGIASLFEETCTQFGTYMPNDGLGWGCHSPVPRAHGASANSFIRFHFTGSLVRNQTFAIQIVPACQQFQAANSCVKIFIGQELSLMVLDLFDHTGLLSDLHRYLSIPFAVVEGFRQRFPKVDPKTGKTDMFPAQVGS